MKHRSIASILKTLLLTTGILLLVGCAFAGEDRQAPQESIEGGQSVNTGEIELECEAEGYPCSYADANPKVLEQSTEALEQAAQALEEGESIEDAVSVLRARRDVAEILYAPEALRFRLEDGPAMWLINGAAIATGSKGPGGAGGLRPNFSIEIMMPSDSSNQDDGPIGTSQRGEEPDKKALLLSPFYWEFGEDETNELLSMLQRQHNYDCADCITYKLNNVRSRQEGESQRDYEFLKTMDMDYGISILDFMNWDTFDLIHLSTHGTQVCRDGKCASAIFTGRYIERDDWSYEGGPNFDVPGVGWVRTAVPGCGNLEQDLASDDLSDEEWGSKFEEWKTKGCPTFTNRWWQLLETDFFSHHYSGSGKTLDEKLIFISACSSMKDLHQAEIGTSSTLAASISGDNTTVLGWTETVDAGAAEVVAERFYELYIQNGLRAEKAYEQVKEQFGDKYQADDLLRFRPKGIEIEALVPPEFLQEGEQDTQGREIITLLQPIFRVELQERDSVPTLGMPGDGEQDEVLLLVQIDGIDEDLNPEEFTIHFAVDGTELENTVKPQLKTGEYSYQALAMMKLPFDAGNRQFVELEGWVELPKGGESRHVLEEVELANCGWSASLSGSRSGEVEGDIVLPTSSISTATVEQLTQLAENGFLGPNADTSSGLPSADELKQLPEAYMLGNRDQIPFFMIIPGQSATAMLENQSLAVAAQATVSKGEDSDVIKEGGFSATFTELMTQQNFSAQGEYTWHAESFCSMDVILEMAENPFPESMISGGLQ